MPQNLMYGIDFYALPGFFMGFSGIDELILK